jgi:hypothetical protein
MPEGFRPEENTEVPAIERETEQKPPRRTALKMAALALATRFGLGHQEAGAEETEEDFEDFMLEEAVEIQGDVDSVSPEDITEEQLAGLDPLEIPLPEDIDATRPESNIDGECSAGKVIEGIYIPQVPTMPERQSLGSLTIQATQEIYDSRDEMVAISHVIRVLRSMGFSIGPIQLIPNDKGRNLVLGGMRHTGRIRISEETGSGGLAGTANKGHSNVSVMSLNADGMIRILMHEIIGHGLTGSGEHHEDGIRGSHFSKSDKKAFFPTAQMVADVYKAFGTSYGGDLASLQAWIDQYNERAYTAYRGKNKAPAKKPATKTKGTSRPQPRSRRSFLGGIKK